MKLFYYTMYIYGEHCAGIVQANNLIHAKQILRIIYSDWDKAETEIKEVEYDRGVCEIYYGS